MNNADFSPDMAGYSGQDAFRFWCQKVLPIVYDDSLSYYELLNKIVVYLNNVIADVSNVETNVEALFNAYNQLQDYVNHYFDNLDVQKEINVKLNDMAESGALSGLIEPFVNELIGGVVEEQIGDTVADQIGGVVSEQIDASVASQISQPVADNVTIWLNENVDPVGSAVVVDSSLTVSGAAADAKTTGDALDAMQEEFDDLKSTTDYLTECNMAEEIAYGIKDSATNVNITASQDGNLITINGTSSATSGQIYTKILICDHTQIWNSATTPDAANIFPIKMLSGHFYKMSLMYISGSREKGEGSGAIGLLYASEDGTLANSISLGNEGSAIATSVLSTGSNIRLTLGIASLMTATNLVVKVTLTDITQKINDISPKSVGKSIEGASGKVIGYPFLSFDHEGVYYSTDSVGSQSRGEIYGFIHNCCYASCSCVAGDKFSIRTYGASGGRRAWAFYDENDIVLSRSTNTEAINETVITAPENAVKVVINNSKAYLPDGFYAIKGEVSENLLESILNTNSRIDSTNARLDDIEENIGTSEHKETITGSVGWYWDSQGTVAVKTEYATYRYYEPYDVVPGEHYRVRIYSAYSEKQNPVLLVDDEYTIVKRYTGTRTAINDFDIVVPYGVTKMLLTTDRGHSGSLYKVEQNVISELFKLPAGMFNYKNANVAIIGDSISTNGDYSESNLLGNVPEIVVGEEDVGVELSAYVTWWDVYSNDSGTTLTNKTIGGHTFVSYEIGTEVTFIPTEDDIGKFVGTPRNNNSASTNTWWEVAMTELEFNPIPVCWSGSSITSHEGGNPDAADYNILRTSYSWHPSQIRKCGIRTPGTMNRVAPDMIIICRGSNDLSHAPYSRLTNELDSFPTTYPDVDTYDDGGTTRYSFVQGMRLLIKTLREAYPEAKIVITTLNYFRRLSTTAKYTNNGTDNWISYNDMIRRIADYESCDIIDFAKDGLMWSNAANGYYNEGTSSTAKWTHPNDAGQLIMGNRALRDMMQINNKPVAT